MFSAWIHGGMLRDGYSYWICCCCWAPCELPPSTALGWLLVLPPADRGLLLSPSRRRLLLSIYCCKSGVWSLFYWLDTYCIGLLRWSLPSSKALFEYRLFEVRSSPPALPLPAWRRSSRSPPSQLFISFIICCQNCLCRWGSFNLINIINKQIQNEINRIYWLSADHKFINYK